jgi:hypothetical protein
VLGTLKYEGKNIAGRQMVEVLNAMGLDLATFGNHEFDLKEAELLERLRESRFGWVSSNAGHWQGDSLRRFPQRPRRRLGVAHLDLRFCRHRRHPPPDRRDGRHPARHAETLRAVQQHLPGGRNGLQVPGTL